jgi:hypothetical protein
MHAEAVELESEGVTAETSEELIEEVEQFINPII